MRFAVHSATHRSNATNSVDGIVTPSHPFASTHSTNCSSISAHVVSPLTRLHSLSPSKSHFSFPRETVVAHSGGDDDDW